MTFLKVGRSSICSRASGVSDAAPGAPQRGAHADGTGAGAVRARCRAGAVGGGVWLTAAR